MQKLLVANRGEIALRIMKTAQKMGIQTVAVYSEADRNAPFVLFADEAYLLGPPPSNQSYLLGDKIIDIALKAGVDGIHPGYGFLSENAIFAQAVTDAGIKFVGPSPHAMRIMGSKLAAKEAVKGYDIPMVPGTDTAVTDIAEAKQLADEMGYPILIKASAGGGGKGMRIVEQPDDFVPMMERAQSEAKASFGDDAVFVEKYIVSPKHIEIQVLADKKGHTVHLFERDCSVQRRHQKVVEEAPSAILTPDLRRRMGKAAINVAKACQYEGAGTVEFLVDKDRNFYFLEMNTRLQVEHPVTEMITGLDLVEQQIKIADGHDLDFAQADLKINGHAFELRVYAEDSMNNFLPSTGTLTTYQRPEGEGVRVDDGFREGMEIPIYYDPMISKLAVWAPTRQAAAKKMLQAIHDYKIKGIETTLPFGKFVFRHPAFLSGDFTTNFVNQYFTPEQIEQQNEKAASVAAKMGLYLYLEEKRKLKV